MDVTAPPGRSRLSLYLDLIRWDRPAGTLLLLWPTLSALWIAADGFPGVHLLVVFVVGTFLMRSAGCAAYDVAYAMVDRDDDLRIGIKTSAITLGRFDVAAVMVFYAAFLALWAAAGIALGYGWPYFAGLAVAAAIGSWHFTLIRTRSREGCFRAFRLNHWLGFA